jgi:YHS domain-containing protein
MKTLVMLAFALALTAGCARHRDDDDMNGDRTSSTGRNEPRDNNSRAPTDSRVKDSVCGMMCDRNTARTTVYDNKTYFFCSDSCRDKFKDSPSSYLSRN